MLVLSVPETKNLEILKRLQKRHNKNARQIAEMIGYSHQTVRKWRAGMAPTPDIAIKLLTLLLK